MSFDRDYCSLPLPSIDKRVRWHAETNHRLPPFVVFKIIEVFFVSQRQASPLACGGYRCLPLFIFFKDYQSLLSRLQCLPYLARLQGLLLMHLMPLMLFILAGFADWASGQSGGEITRTKLVSLSLLPFYLQ